MPHVKITSSKVSKELFKCYLWTVKNGRAHLAKNIHRRLYAEDEGVMLIDSIWKIRPKRPNSNDQKIWINWIKIRNPKKVHFWNAILSFALLFSPEQTIEMGASKAVKIPVNLTHMWFQLVLVSILLKFSLNMYIHINCIAHISRNVHSFISLTIYNDKPYNLCGRFEKKIIIIYVISIRKQCLVSHQCGDKMNYITYANQNVLMKNWHCDNFTSW